MPVLEVRLKMTMPDDHERRVPVSVLLALQRALKSATLDGCGVDADAQERMRLYLATWCAGPLKQAIAWAKGEISAGDLVRW
jgi:hypothetical protein